ncbi:MAG: ankyrin repeat domain-containing protein [Syntrophales bacterium]|nr:ankyrin repeat domain-containing protein [Syntrophales bacterium]MDD5641203.1 ankyrin repeat domain-containing protein [Syntrophales bacterium]
MDGRFLIKAMSRHIPPLVLVLLLLSLLACADSREEAKAKLESIKVPYNNDSIIYRAAIGDAAAVRLFLAAGMDPNVRDNQGVTPLIAAARSGKTEVVKLLLEQGADLKAQNPERVIKRGKKRRKKKIRYGGTPLMHAARGGHADTVRLLLAKGADLNTLDAKHGLAALHWAVYHNQLGAVETLLDQGANPGVKDKRGFTPLMLAAHYAKPDIVSLLADRTPPAEQEAAKRSSLLIAAAAGRTDNVELLLAKGADANARGDNSLTPLMLAARAGKKDTVKLLLKRGADANARDRTGNRALEYAKANEELMNLLFQAESSKSAPSNK